MPTLKDEISRCASLSDTQLWTAVPRLLRDERDNLASFLIHLAEVNRRELHLRHAYSGLFRYLIKLGLSEWESRARDVAAIAVTKYPSVLGLLRSGRLNLTAIAMVGPHLTSENYRALLRKACRRSTRELQVLVASLAPGAKRRDVVRVVAAPTPPGVSPSAGAVSVLERADGCEREDRGLFPDLSPSTHSQKRAVAGRRLRFSFDGPEELHGLISRARDILFHKYPKGEMSLILIDAMNALLDKIDPERRFQRRVERARRRARVGTRMDIDGLIAQA